MVLSVALEGNKRNIPGLERCGATDASAESGGFVLADLLAPDRAVCRIVKDRGDSPVGEILVRRRRAAITCIKRVRTETIGHDAI